jgi:hypothetical protein
MVGRLNVDDIVAVLSTVAVVSGFVVTPVLGFARRLNAKTPSPETGRFLSRRRGLGIAVGVGGSIGTAFVGDDLGTRVIAPIVSTACGLAIVLVEYRHEKQASGAG